MTHDKISLLITNWRRPENVKRILRAESKIQVIDEILLLNNNPKVRFAFPHPKVKILNSSRDLGPRSRWVLGAFAKNDCLVFQDDDILLNETVFNAFLHEVMVDRERAYSLHGYNPDSIDRYNCREAFGEVEIVLTRATAIHKESIAPLLDAEYDYFYDEADYPDFRAVPLEDLFLSYFLLYHYKKKHRVLRLPFRNLRPRQDLNARGYGKLRTKLMRECKTRFFGLMSGARSPFELPADGVTVHSSEEDKPFASVNGLLQPPVKKLRLRCFLSPGDILMLTAAVRDLHLSFPGRFITDVESSCPAIWENNPFITSLPKDDSSVEQIEMHYPLIHRSNEGPYHFIHGYRLFLEDYLGIRIRPTRFAGDIHFRPEELHWISAVHENFTSWDSPYWLICSGGKTDFTTKWWLPEYAQRVVDHFRDRIQFVQFGGVGTNHYHPPLKGVINLVGCTDLRAFMLLMYHASGVISPISFAMHLAAAIPAKPGFPRHKPCVVTAGGREPSVWEAYTHHVFLSTNGQLYCCENGGCWKNRTVALSDGDEKDKSLCVNTVEFNGRHVQRCMHDLVTSEDVIEAVERYYKCGVLAYLPPGTRTIQSAWRDRLTRKANPRADYSNSRIGSITSRLRIALIVSGTDYQKSAALSAATYRTQMGDYTPIGICLPKGERITSELTTAVSDYDLELTRFPLRLVTSEKFTSQLKCQGLLAALDALEEDRLLLVVDADTYCLRPIRFPQEIVNRIREGAIGFVQDVEDRHDQRPNVPWFLPKEQRLPYVNSGVILASRSAFAIVKRFAEYASDRAYLKGPFNDQNIINCALGRNFRDRLALLDKRFNGMQGYFNEQTVIAHVSGGAGKLRLQQRDIVHRNECLRIIRREAAT
jgi:hypothetical protein